MTIFAKGPDKVLPVDMSAEFPGYACLLGNLLEAAALAFARPDCSFDLVNIVGFEVNNLPCILYV